VVLHGAGVGLAALALRATYPGTYRQTPWTFLALVTGFCGPLPVLGLLFLAGFRELFKSPAKEDPAKNYYFGERQVLTVDRFEESGRNAHRSFFEILSGRDNVLRRKAILALRSVDVKKALPVLQKAIQDGDEQVRLLAQTQYNKIIAKLELTIKKLEASLAQSTREPGRLVQLAEQYHELVFLGLSSDETQKIYLDRATELLREALQTNPELNPARVLLLKCLVKNGARKDARECLDQLRAKGFDDRFLGLWEAELLFEERDWPGLRGLLQRMQSSRLVDSRLQRQLEFWLNPAGSK
jgi:tetratricopeptide (TPR) repeat protein